MAAELGGGDSGHKKKGGVKKGKKLSTAVDLTPMVDLGFLLITFFMLTTTMSKPKTMEINMPYKDDKEKTEETKLKQSAAMTVLLGADHNVYYYYGIGDDPANPPQVVATKFTNQDGIRDAIIKKKKEVDALKAAGRLDAKDNMTVLIKPDAASSYDDLVNILDEMNINDIRTYAIVDITPVDKELAGMP